MIDPELFNSMIDMLTEVHNYWKSMGPQTRGLMLSQLNSYSVSEKEFGDFCLTVMGQANLQPADIVGHFKNQHVERFRQKALPEPKVNPDMQSDEFVRFLRMNRQLQAALRHGKSYPTNKLEFKRLWQEPLTEEDRDYASERKQHRVQLMGVDLMEKDCHKGVSHA